MIIGQNDFAKAPALAMMLFPRYPDFSYTRKNQTAGGMMEDQDAIGMTGPQLREYTEAEIRQFLEDDKIGDEYNAPIPKVSRVAALGDLVAKMLQRANVSIDDVLLYLEEVREAYYRDHYGDILK